MKPCPGYIGIVLIAIIMAGAAGVCAETNLSVDGQIRLRNEYDLKSTDTLRHSRTFHDLRTRLGLKFEPTTWAVVYIQLQDSRRLGDPASGDVSATDNVDVHQAYFDIRDAIFRGLRIKAGRFEVNYGSQRVFGSVGWSNIGRSWEGAVFSYSRRDFQVDLFNLKRRELNDPDYNRDFDIVGVYGMIRRISLDFFAFYELDADTNGYVQEKLKRMNIGGYLSRSHKNFDVTAEGNFQSGEQPSGMIPDTLVQDISAFMLAAEVGYSVNIRANPRVALGIDYTSGDDGGDTTKFTAYTNAFYTGHKFQGYMDYFTDSPAHGLVDIMLRGSLSPSQRWVARADIHYFKAAEDYRSKADDTTLTKNVGVEIDLTVINKSIRGATVTGGASIFFADKHFSPAGDDRKAGLWAYLMTSVNF